MLQESGRFAAPDQPCILEMHRSEAETREFGMAKKSRRPDKFSVVQAVKANARERLGTPPPSTPIPDRRTKAERGPQKHKKKMEEVVHAASES